MALGGGIGLRIASGFERKDGMLAFRGVEKVDAVLPQSLLAAGRGRSSAIWSLSHRGPARNGCLDERKYTGLRGVRESSV